MTTNNDSSLEEQARNLRLSDGDLQEEFQSNGAADGDSHLHPSATTTTTARPYRFIPLSMSGNTHVVSPESQALIRDEVSLADLQHMTELFYQKAFRDATLDQFIRSHDDPHGTRFAKWIHQKLSGSSEWDLDRQQRDKTPVKVAGGLSAVVHDRSSAHAAAWHSPKRPRQHVGRHFKLDECRVWMRLHFWALRESGLMEKSPTFAEFYLRFLGHFVRVYERMAPTFARDSFRWSADPQNTERYLQNGRRMTDVLGLSVSQAIRQLPIEESEDPEWPYHQTAPTEATDSESDNDSAEDRETAIVTRAEF